MKIKISRDYGLWKTLRKNDKENYWQTTRFSEYHKWETIDVTDEELVKLIHEGHAIMINC